MPSSTSLVALFMLAAIALAHMQLSYPPPFNASNNPHRITEPDPYLQFPYNCCGPNARWSYPCRGYHNLLGTPEGGPTATWEAGSVQTWNMSGIGNHWGGSRQVGFSIDGGQSFRVVTSYEGNCPHRDQGGGPEGQNFAFTVPHDLDPGIQIFAWIWYNREQEFNMNCAAVSITESIGGSGPGPGSSDSNHRSVTGFPTTTGSPIQTGTIVSTTFIDRVTSTDDRIGQSGDGTYYVDTSTPVISATATCSTMPVWKRPKRPHGRPPFRHAPGRRATATDAALFSFSSRPLMFVANDGNGCKTPHTTAELQFPDPGPDVVSGDGAYPLALPVGSCSEEEMLSKQAYTGND